MSPASASDIMDMFNTTLEQLIDGGCGTLSRGGYGVAVAIVH